MTGTGVVDVVFPAPMVIGREGQHAREKANQIV
jgi:hypothetical protein